MKVKTVFFCKECGAQSSSWIGKCPQCGAWNSYVEEVVQREGDSKFNIKKTKSSSKPQPVNQITFSQEERIDTKDIELNRVLGGGLVTGSVVLVGGEPGIGKSTLMLQVALNCKGRKILYVSGEESLQQIKMRADRVEGENEDCFILTETNIQSIFQHAEDLKPQIIVIDSIQTITTDSIDSSPGSISQIRECAGEIQMYAKKEGIAFFLVGHITKDGAIAGPKILEHIVDTVLQFEGNRHYGYRMLRSIKNRFGSTSELGIYEMQSTGLRQVNNPSEILLSQRDEALSGTAIAATIEGTRPILIETQALVANSNYGTGQRTSTGFDLRRLSMLLAVLEKRGGFKLINKDVFLNIAGGIKVDDPAIDLAVLVSIISSSEDLSISSQYCFAAETGLSGELRPVTRIDQRIAEADKLGFEKIFISKYNIKGLDSSRFKIEIIPLSNIEDVLRYIFS
ncbi:MAG TPA: DNA repair protein RadA [Bacteroidales bacterium]|nr:DNA repair protein RadA [Bacteroidales bacterium]